MAKSTIKIALPLTIFMLAMLVAPVYAATIRIEPWTSGYPSPTMLASPAYFEVSDVSKTDYDPHILLVITPECYNGMSWPVTVSWTGLGSPLVLQQADFQLATHGGGTKIPSPGVKSGCDYTVASCADHLGVSGSDVYYAFDSFLPPGTTITSTKQGFTITASSSNLRMLVYVLGKQSATATLFDNNVPPSQVGFVVPEPATIALMGSLFAAFGLYAYKRRKTT